MMGNCCESESNRGKTYLDPYDAQPLASVELPPGWVAVPSRSRPGRIAYQNMHTGERISWFPDSDSKVTKHQIKRRHKNKNMTHSAKDLPYTFSADSINSSTYQADMHSDAIIQKGSTSDEAFIKVTEEEKQI